MKIYYNQLTNQLRQSLSPIWLLFGDEPWQKQQALTQLKQTAKNQGFDETIQFHANEKFDWQQLHDEYQAMSLFASQRIIEVELASSKISDAGTTILQIIAQTSHQETILILHGAKLDAATSNRKWFKALQTAGVYLAIYEMDKRSVQQWLKQQIVQLNLQMEADVQPLLIELFEGNLQALSQELEKLKLLFAEQLISVNALEKLLINQAKFTPFQLVDALLQGDYKRCINILEQLQQEGQAVGQLIWFMHKELSQLLTLQEQLSQGETTAKLFQQYRIWDKRKPLYQQALANCTIANIKHALARLAQTDLISKTNSDFNPFVLLADICISLSYGEVTQQFSLNYDHT